MAATFNVVCLLQICIVGWKYNQLIPFDTFLGIKSLCSSNFTFTSSNISGLHLVEISHLLIFSICILSPTLLFLHSSTCKFWWQALYQRTWTLLHKICENSHHCKCCKQLSSLSGEANHVIHINIWHKALYFIYFSLWDNAVHQPIVLQGLQDPLNSKEL